MKTSSSRTAREVRRLPAWLRRRVGRGPEVAAVRHLLRERGLHTVCEEAGCPNLGECFGRGVATFLILGDVCTRGCRFCGVSQGVPRPVDPAEPERLADAAAELGLGYVVITSVTRDDLDDGGASWFAACVRAVRARLPAAGIEVLVPDLAGSREALDVVLAAAPDVLNHNVETVPRLYPEVRPDADFERSVALLAAAQGRARTKSGLMVGLGETYDEVLDVLRRLRGAGVDLVTIGQYLMPSRQAHPMKEYVPPEVFEEYAREGRALGFTGVFSAPLVRSSYHAAEQFRREDQCPRSRTRS